MLEFRCALHAFSLVLVAMLAHEHARTLLAMAQRVVVYIRASHMLKQRLEAARKELGIPVTLASAGKTRITSMCELVRTVLLNERSLSNMVKDDRALFRKPDVVNIIEDTSFWRVCCAFLTSPSIKFVSVHCHAYSELLAICRGSRCIAAHVCCPRFPFGLCGIVQELTTLGKLLEPFQRVLLGIQGRQTRLADCTRYFLYLARELRQQRANLPAGVYQNWSMHRD